MADNLKSLETQLAQLEANKAEQVAKQFESLAQSLAWLEDIIDRDIFNLGIVLASYAVFIAQRATHCAAAEIALIMKNTGAAIEALTEALKTANMAQAASDQAAKAAVQETDTPVDTVVKIQLADIKDSITQFTDALNENITQTGSYIESTGDIFENVADIAFDVARIHFDLVALAAQVFEHERIILHTELRMEEAIEATALGVEALIEFYDASIASKEAQIEQRIAFDEAAGEEDVSIISDINIGAGVENIA